MEDEHVGLGPVQLPPGEDIDALVALILHRVHKALLLDAGHIQYVQLGHHGLQTGDLGKAHVILLHEGADIVGYCQLPGGDEEEGDVLEFSQGFDEGVDSAAVFQVAAQADGQVVYFAPQAGDGSQVGHGLGGVHVAAVAGIDHGHVGVEGGGLGCALPGGAHHDDIGIVGDDLDGVLQRLSLGHRGGIGVGKAEYRAAQTEHGRLEGEVGAGGGLVKQVGRHLAPTYVNEFFRCVYDLTGPVVQAVPLLAGQITKIN